MQRTRHRKSKSATSIEGIQQIEKRKAAPRLSSDSQTPGGGTTGNDMFMLEVGQSSSRRATGTPIKKLLAEEMSKEIEVKRRSPSVIARLMGLDGLPSPRHVHIQQRSSSDIYEQKNVSICIQRNGQLLDGQSSRRTSMEQQEFKDVYEDVEASHIASRRNSSRWSTNSKLTKSESALIQQKFTNANQLSADEKLLGTKEYSNTLELVDSNKGSFQKYLQHPDSLSVKHIHDLEIDPSSSLRGHIEVLKPSNSAKYECNAKAWKSEREISCKHDMTSHQKREDGLLLHPHSRHRAHASCKSPQIQLDDMKGRNTLPTRIVVLKPNLGKIQSACASVSSPGYSHNYPSNFRKLTEYTSVGGAEILSRKRRGSSDDVGSLKPLSRDAREIAKEITRRMRDGCDGFIDPTSSGVRGYAGDESSYDAYESDSASESEVFKLSSRNSTRCNNRHKYSHFGPIESSVNWEAKKRLSARWKTTHRCQDLEMAGNASTLGEMLAKPNRETGPKYLYANVGLERTSGRNMSNNGAAIWDFPLGISNTDGWKDKRNRISSRSRSLSPSFVSGKTLRRRMNSVTLTEDQYLMHNDTVSCGRSESMKGNLSWKEDISSKDIKYRSEKPSCHHKFTDEIDSSTESNFEIQTEMNFETNPSEQQSTSQITAKDGTCTTPIPDAKTAAKHGVVISSSKSSELQLKQSYLEVEKDKNTASDKEDSSFQFPGAEPDSTESSKNADYHSPVSVLEVPFTEDISSSSESFERVSAELHELRMQLQLLKMESREYPEVPARISSEEDVAQHSLMNLEQNHKLGAEDWEASYVLDVLINLGFEESDLDLFRTTWHSSECPLNPELFDNLEKKYSHEQMESRSERRLLFDGINSVFVDVYQQLVDPFPWVMPKLTGVDLKGPKQMIRDNLQKLLSGQDFEAEREIPESILDRDMQWFEFKGEIDVIGNEIEKLLIDDMITEVQIS
ncbi:uncharacterized protein LOC111391729 isoform X2 [Olea europaea var. sylvestris]|uniref:uncharacterized protein LOC111391729 isoform X2 n=1 Tax=Olea europaea var. sylvestris TaxID=158386 RepID=UPI000C1D4CE0|nr:uncharacterized protein LOC111391729 isoform X2 [Olea europaea var. sylvestris]